MFTVFPPGFDVGLPEGSIGRRPTTPPQVQAWIDTIAKKSTFINFRCFPNFLNRPMFKLAHDRANKGDTMAVDMLFVMLRDHVHACYIGW